MRPYTQIYLPKTQTDEKSENRTLVHRHTETKLHTSATYMHHINIQNYEKILASLHMKEIQPKTSVSSYYIPLGIFKPKTNIKFQQKLSSKFSLWEIEWKYFIRSNRTCIVTPFLFLHIFLKTIYAYTIKSSELNCS